MINSTIEIQKSCCAHFLKARGWKIKLSRTDKLVWCDPLTKCLVSIETATEVQLEREVNTQ